MPNHHRHLWRTIGVATAVIATVLLVVAVYVVTTHRGDGRHEHSSIAHDTTGQHARRHRHHRHKSHPQSSEATAVGTESGGSLSLPLGGGNPQVNVTFVPGVPRHAVLRVTTSGAPAGIRYAFRTSQGVHSSDTRTTNSSWTAAATVVGTEPLTGVIAQVASGTVTCTVSIDGQVVDRKSNSGSFATVSCYG